MTRLEIANKLVQQSGACHGILCKECFAYNSPHCSDTLDLSPRMPNAGLSRMAAAILKLPKKNKQSEQKPAPRKLPNVDIKELALFVHEDGSLSLGFVDNVQYGRVFKVGSSEAYARSITLRSREDLIRDILQVADKI